jgi:uncharacterized protein (TIGR03067 family)
MLIKSLWLCPLLLLTFTQDAAEKAKADLKKMQGEWVMETLEINGKSVSKIQESFLIVKDDEYKTRVKKSEPPGFKLKLDPSKDPKHVDMIRDEGGFQKVYKGIYTFEKGSLKICRGISPEQERPTVFATWPDTGYFVVTWKKKQP